MFQKAEIKRFRRLVHRELGRMGFERTADAARGAGLVLIAAVHFGTDAGVLAEISGQTPAVVRRVLARLRQQRVIVGQKVRVAWNDADKWAGFLAVALDVMVAGGELVRPVDPKRSAALKGRASAKRGGTRRPSVTVAPGAVFSPQIVESNPLYQIGPASVAAKAGGR